MTLTCTMILGDCLKVMPALPQHTNMVFADIPYALGKQSHTKNKWDLPFDADSLFTALRRIASANAVLLFAANDRLAAYLASLRPNFFRYSIVVEKTQASLYFHANHRLLLAHEIVQVFGETGGTYNPQKTMGRPHSHNHKGHQKDRNQHDSKRTPTVSSGHRFPRSIFRVSAEHRAGKPNIHPTQKPIALLDWLIRTYSNPGDNVLDPVAGSFTTCASACMNGRNSVGIEKDACYFEAGVERVRKTIADNKLDVRLEVRR